CFSRFRSLCVIVRPPPPPLFPYTTLFRSPWARSICWSLGSRSRERGGRCGMGGVGSPGRGSGSRRGSSHTHGLLSVPYWRGVARSEEHTSELQSLTKIICRLLLDKQNKRT